MGLLIRMIGIWSMSRNDAGDLFIPFFLVYCYEFGLVPCTNFYDNDFNLGVFVIFNVL